MVAITDRALVALRAYVDREGHACPEAGFKEDGFALGYWASLMRSAYRNGTLSASDVASLEALPGWTWDPLASQVPRYIRALQSYVEAKGSVEHVPHNTRADELNLTQALSYLRAQYREGVLSTDAVRELEALPGWAWDRQGAPPVRGAAALSVQTVLAYAEAHGSVSRLPSDASLGGHNVSRMASDLRARYRRGELTDDVVSELEALSGWVWAPVRGANFSEGLPGEVRSVIRFVKKGGDLSSVPADVTVRGTSLAWVIDDLRLLFERGELPVEAVDALDALPGWSWERDRPEVREQVEHPLPRRLPDSAVADLLREFAAENGHTMVPRYHEVRGFPLGTWVKTRRRLHRQGKLPARVTRLLEQLPGWVWDPVVARRKGTDPESRQQASERESVLRYLKGYIAEHGTLAFVEDATEWRGERVLDRMEWLRAEGARMTPKERSEVASLPGWGWSVSDRKFERMLERLRQFARREGHASVIWHHVESGDRLGKWVAQQRYLYGQEKLSAERIKKLQKVKGWVWSAAESKA